MKGMNMQLSDEHKKLLDSTCPVLKRAKLGSMLSGMQIAGGAMKQAEAVSDAAGETPTAAEFNALLASLRAAGILAK